jgi:pyrimidine-specific ribonucleoside hydrolase
MPIPLVIDCDPGVDDALALAMALASPAVELRAVTTVAGNVPLARTTDNALRLLEAFGRADVAVAPGAADALVRDAPPHPPLHGSNGLGGVELPRAGRRADGDHAVEVLAEVLRGAPARSVTIAAIAPLTNIALLISLHPELTDRIERLVIMGGSVGAGNITPFAEFNAWKDPEAARSVLVRSPVEVRLVALDVAWQATLGERELERLRAGSDHGSLLAEMITGYADRGPGGWALHDALALGSIIDPTLLTTEPATIEVDTGLGSGRGRTFCLFEGGRQQLGMIDEPRAGRPVDVAVDLDLERFRETVLALIAGDRSPAAG